MIIVAACILIVLFHWVRNYRHLSKWIRCLNWFAVDLEPSIRRWCSIFTYGFCFIVRSCLSMLVIVGRFAKHFLIDLDMLRLILHYFCIFWRDMLLFRPVFWYCPSKGCQSHAVLLLRWAFLSPLGFSHQEIHHLLWCFPILTHLLG